MAVMVAPVMHGLATQSASGRVRKAESQAPTPRLPPQILHSSKNPQVLEAH